MTERENYIRVARFDNPECAREKYRGTYGRFRKIYGTLILRPRKYFACGGLFYYQSKNFVL
ncbi:MAG: hypothetical protein IJX06_01730 [Clostridia bacterium]|nr:hypothetical protein [Clostridia bacterium]